MSALAQFACAPSCPATGSADVTTSRTAPAGASWSNVDFSSRFGGSAMPIHGSRMPGVRVHLTHACAVLRIGMAQILSAEPGLDVIEGESLEDHADDHSVVITDYSAGMHMLTQR